MNSVVQFLRRSARRYGTRIAVEDENRAVTYAELQAESMNIGTALLEKREAYAQKNPGQGSDCKRPVMVFLPKSVECIAAFMGILFSGSSYVPIDTNIGLNRIQKMIDNLKPSFIITDGAGQEKISQCEQNDTRVVLYDQLVQYPAKENLIESALTKVLDTDPAYVIFTSGSTGTPKGVVISHRSVVDYAHWVANTFDVDENTIMGNQSAFYFDNSILDIYGCFSTGAKMIIIPEPLFLYPAKLPDYVNEKNINFIFWVPTIMIGVANSGILSEVTLPGLKKVLFCGEVMPNAQLNIWRKALPDVMFANLYGPSEITDVCTYYVVDRPFEDNDPLPIGKPCENMDILILNEKNELAKTGEIGELCVLGTGLALGYWNAPELSDKVFVQNPLNPHYHERMYRTGDLAYWAEDGLISFVGRNDTQIKLNGNRIELGDIEAAARCVEGVENVCVLFHAKVKQIVIFIESEKEVKLRKFNMELKKYIPKYMLPGRMEVMEKLPLTSNGKIDRVTLRTFMEANS